LELARTTLLLLPNNKVTFVAQHACRTPAKRIEISATSFFAKISY
jgi:hypothetical protein